MIHISMSGVLDLPHLAKLVAGRTGVAVAHVSKLGTVSGH
jgi:hypothetical protein